MPAQRGDGKAAPAEAAVETATPRQPGQADPVVATRPAAAPHPAGDDHLAVVLHGDPYGDVRVAPGEMQLDGAAGPEGAVGPTGRPPAVDDERPAGGDDRAVGGNRDSPGRFPSVAGAHPEAGVCDAAVTEGAVEGAGARPCRRRRQRRGDDHETAKPIRRQALDTIRIIGGRPRPR